MPPMQFAACIVMVPFQPQLLSVVPTHIMSMSFVVPILGVIQFLIVPICVLTCLFLRCNSCPSPMRLATSVACHIVAVDSFAFVAFS